MTREVRADNTTDTTYTYDLVGRLKTVTDPEDQVTTYSYNLDDTLLQVAFTNATIATPTISFTYDPYYPRKLTMVDGVGTTTYAYTAVGTAGALGLASVDGPFSADTITYGYDALGRVTSRLLNSTGTAVTYDPLGRIAQLAFPIGTFDYTYVDHTGRVDTVTYSNDQTSTYSYVDAEHDFRLQTIHHKNPSAATLSKFDYTYDVVGNILTWRQERAGATTQQYTFTNDAVDQLTSAVLTDTNSLRAEADPPSGGFWSEQPDAARAREAPVARQVSFPDKNQLPTRTASRQASIRGTRQLALPPTTRPTQLLLAGTDARAQPHQPVSCPDGRTNQPRGGG